MDEVIKDEYGRPRVFLEEKCPIEPIGIECQRESGSGLHPPVNRLHVWWARRPLTLSRASILGSILPVDFDEKDYLELLGIPRGKDPVKSRRIIEEVQTGIRKDRVKDPYGYDRAFKHKLSIREKEKLTKILSELWNTENPTILDSFAGGGCIPFESVRLGFPVIMNELNPVACIIQKATVEYPSKFGIDLSEDMLRIGKNIEKKVHEKLHQFFPRNPGEKNLSFIWTRTITCSKCELIVPLSPNFWLDKNNRIGYKLIIPKVGISNTCDFKINKKDDNFNPDIGTIKMGTATCPRCKHTLDGDYIKKEAQDYKMGHQLAAIGYKLPNKRGRFFRAPSEKDLDAVKNSTELLQMKYSEWKAKDLIPEENRYIGPADRSANYGVVQWKDIFSPRQLMVHITHLELLLEYPWDEITDKLKREALRVYLFMAFSKCINFDSIQSRHRPTYGGQIASTFDRHDFSFKWSYAEIDGDGQLFRFGYEEIINAYKGLCNLLPQNNTNITLINGDASNLSLEADSVQFVLIDPPYYDNVMYAELSDFFYVWMKRFLKDVFPELFSLELTDKDSETVANFARFKDSGKGMRRKLAFNDYEAKMTKSFAECYRVMKKNGVFTVMFTHKKVEAWDSLAKSLMNTGFEITASWPIHTEFEKSLHQAKKNAAASTILLVCRKRPDNIQSAWWEDIKEDLDNIVMEKAIEFEKKGLRGQDTFIACFGPALQILSRNWPVKTKDGEVISPQEALDRARRVVGDWFIEKITYGKATEMDKTTRFYILAWYIYKAREVKFDEINRLAISMGIDLDKLKQNKLLEKKGGYVRFLKPVERFRARALKSDVESYKWDIDYVHAAIYSYEIGKTVELNRFHQRTGAVKRHGYLDSIAYLLDILPKTEEVSEYHTLYNITTSALQEEVKQRINIEKHNKEYSTEQSVLFEQNK